MPSGYHHLTFEKRCQIEALLEKGDSLRSIARALGCHVSTISREVKRNTGQRGYQMKPAQRFATERRRVASSVPRKMTAASLGPDRGDAGLALESGADIRPSPA